MEISGTLGCTAHSLLRQSHEKTKVRDWYSVPELHRLRGTLVMNE